MNAPYSRVEVSQETKVEYVEEITENPDITTPTLEVVLEVTDTL